MRATDPIQIAEELCGESVQIELVQLSYPAGEKLGVFVDNAREFLFPTPKVTPSYPGVDRELLFERSPTFPGKCIQESPALVCNSLPICRQTV